MLGFLIGVGLGWVGKSLATKNATRQPEASRWNGTAGTVAFTVYRNGPSWAWSSSTGSGAELSAIAALRAALSFALETGAVQNEEGIDVERGDRAITASVRYFPNDADAPWHSVVAQNGKVAKTGAAKTRGAAALVMVEALQPYVFA